MFLYYTSSNFIEIEWEQKFTVSIFQIKVAVVCDWEK